MFAAILGFLGVALGAFGSHALRDRLSPTMIGLFENWSALPAFHALAAVLAAVAVSSFHPGFMLGAGWLFVVGTVFFFR